MSGECGVLDYAGCFFKAVGSVDSVNDGSDGLSDGLASFTTFCSCSLGQSRSHTKL